MSKWLKLWKSKEYQELKTNNFNKIDKFLKSPKNILDIGCGYAFESEMFQKKYQTELYLLDSSIDKTRNVLRQTNYGLADNFSFYHSLNQLTESFDQRKMTYTFIDSNNTSVLNLNLNFDVIYSFLSCGFHYPANTYKDFILKHSNFNTVIILDLRKKTIDEQLSDIEIIDTIYESKKHITAQIKFR